MITLRAFQPGDAELVSSWAPTDSDVWTWVTRRTVPVPAQTIRQWAAETGTLSFIATLDQRPVGFGQVWIDDDEDDAEVARVLVAPGQRGLGFGRQLAVELARVGLQHRPAVVRRVDPGNEAGLRAYRGARFARVRAEDEAEYNDAQPVEYVWMRLST